MTDKIDDGGWRITSYEHRLEEASKRASEVVTPHAARADERTGHYVGQSICRYCRHEWTAICPDTANPFFLECPSCGRMDGVMGVSGMTPMDVQRHYETRIKEDRLRARIESDY